MNDDDKPATIVFRAPGPAAITGQVSIEGRDVSHLTRRVQIDSAVGELTRVQFELLARHGLDLTVPAQVAVTFIVQEPGIVDVTDEADGGKRYVFKAVTA